MPLPAHSLALPADLSSPLLGHLGVRLVASRERDYVLTPSSTQKPTGGEAADRSRSRAGQGRRSRRRGAYRREGHQRGLRGASLFLSRLGIRADWGVEQDAMVVLAEKATKEVKTVDPETRMTDSYAAIRTNVRSFAHLSLAEDD